MDVFMEAYMNVCMNSLMDMRMYMDGCMNRNSMDEQMNEFKDELIHFGRMG